MATSRGLRTPPSAHTCLPRRLAAAGAMISTYLEAARHAAQFSAYERLFSLWHILHVPFVFMLVISGVVHVIAVHMY